MQQFHAKSAKICQLIEKKLDKDNIYGIREAETLQDFYDYSLQQTTRLQALEKEAIFLRAMVKEVFNDMQELGVIAEKETIKKAYGIAKTPEAKQALKEWAYTLVQPLKK